jgi:hypothetical protein
VLGTVAYLASATVRCSATRSAVWSELRSTRPMKFNIYGLFQIEVHREDDSWVAYQAALGKRRRVEELVIPCELTTEELAAYLDAFFSRVRAAGAASRTPTVTPFRQRNRRTRPIRWNDGSKGLQHRFHLQWPCTGQRVCLCFFPWDISIPPQPSLEGSRVWVVRAAGSWESSNEPAVERPLCGFLAI